MKIFSRFNLFALILVVSAVTMPASAATISQLWAVDTNNVDKIEFFLINPTSGFASPAITSLPGGWSANTINPGYTVAMGPAVSAGTQYVMNFDTSINDPLVLDVLEWNGANLQEHLRFYYKPSNPGDFNTHFQPDWHWNLGPQGSFVDPTLAGVEYNRTPEPATLAMMGLGLAALGMFHRRQRTGNK